MSSLNNSNNDKLQNLFKLFTQIYTLPNPNIYSILSKNKYDSINYEVNDILHDLVLNLSVKYNFKYDKIKNKEKSFTSLSSEEYTKVLKLIKSAFLDKLLLEYEDTPSFLLINDFYRNFNAYTEETVKKDLNKRQFSRNKYNKSSILTKKEEEGKFEKIPSHYNKDDLFDKLLLDISEKRKEKKMLLETKRCCDSLFKKLDNDKDGFLTEEEVVRQLENLRLPKKLAKEVFNQADISNDGKISYNEFTAYIESKILRFCDVFYSLDINNDMELTQNEMKIALNIVFPHVEINDMIFKRLYKSIDENNSGTITLEEWCQFLLFFPEENFNYIANLHNIYAATASIPGESSFNILDLDLKDLDKQDHGNKPSSFRLSRLFDILKNLICGAISGGISRTVTAPLENLKILYQSHYNNKKTPNLVKGIYNIYESKGFPGLFKGNSISIYISCLEQSLRFAIIDYSKRSIQENKGMISTKTLFFIGLGTGFSCSIFLYPLEVIRVHLISDSSLRNTFKSILNLIYKEQGIRGFYSGYVPHIISVLPSGSCHVVLYNTLKKVFINKDDYENLKMRKFMVLGGFAGVLTSTFTYPLNILTTKTIVENKHLSSLNRISFLSIMRRIKNNEGVSGFYKGWIPNILRISLGQSINFGVFETMRGMMNSV